MLKKSMRLRESHLMIVIFSSLVVGVIGNKRLPRKELSKIKTSLKNAIEDGMPGLTICGGYQF